MDDKRARLIQAIFLIALAASIVSSAVLTYVEPMINTIK